jgi:hypothetical protein
MRSPAPRCAHGHDRISFEGEDLRLRPKSAVALSMALHELGTNALKYGALSVGRARSRCAWSTSDGRFRLRWEEKGGPPVSPPTHRGFGSRMIERGCRPSCGRGRASTGGRRRGLHQSMRRWWRSMRNLIVRRVLVVEDEVLVGMLIEEMLQALGYELVALSTHLDEALVAGAHGVVRLRGARHQPQRQAELSGRRRDPQRAACPSCSHRLRQPHPRRALRHDDTPILQKPFSLDETAPHPGTRRAFSVRRRRHHRARAATRSDRRCRTAG